MKKILAIETSCDDTGLAYVECEGSFPDAIFKVISSRLSSQTLTHSPYGGVVPMLAKREHIKNLPLLLEEIKKEFRGKNIPFTPDEIAVTIGPGLEPALWAGLEFAKSLATELNLPLVGVNHLEGHIYSNWLNEKSEKETSQSRSNFAGFFPKDKAQVSNTREAYVRVNVERESEASNAVSGKKDAKLPLPALILLVSGGHTILLLMKAQNDFQILGETRDDAVGEAFDKVAKMLGLPYPGGPEIERLTRYHSGLDLESSKCKLPNSSSLIKFPRPMINSKDYDFSFSGLKTAVLYHLRDNPIKNDENKALIAASFQAAVFDLLKSKIKKAINEFHPISLFLCGGVAMNSLLRTALTQVANESEITFHAPAPGLNSDNAIMIAFAAYLGRPYPTSTVHGHLSL
ncbi:MAG: tRNA (adenosine(37)-N6)-threonylcarbamoyltransferase complex transferase subunit TsaD [Candidatus Harrisonbacteria bacterium]|nr:tRNA (adenosine(37)-N6)-threonylcarbamoyltransferase complex transferase subunit TsaD [Candidatus Harrisonbacteria bacterium]